MAEITDKSFLIDLYGVMQKIRLFEEMAEKLYSAGKIPGSLHFYIGEESVATGVTAALKKDDYITSTHRGHGHLVAKGGDLKLMMAELLGRKTGYCKGKGGSMHICDLSLGIMGSNGIVGAGLPIAVGVGCAAQLRGNRQVCVCFFGDGAANRGTFHESINMASIWKLPVIYVCENNMYGISGCTRETMNICDVAERAKAYGIPGTVVEGNDVLEVYKAADEAVKRAREGQGPTLIECKTWRHRGHWQGDPDNYRDPEEHKKWLAKDPITNFARKLKDEGIASKDELEAIDKKIKEMVDEAVDFANESPWPEEKDLTEDIFV